MNPELRQLRYFVALAEELSFTRAAERLHVAQQTLSGAIGRLEQQLGVELVNRTTRQVKLTAAGETLAGQARLVLHAAERAVEATRATARGEQGTLTLGYFLGVAGDLGPRIVQRFRERHPRARLQLRSYDFHDPSGGLHAGHADAAFIRPPMNLDGIALEPLFREPRLAILSALHPLAKERALTIDQLVQETWMDTPATDSIWRRFWLALDQRDGIPPKLGPTVDGADTWVDTIATSQAVALSTHTFQRAVNDAGVVFVSVDDLAPSLAAMAWRHDNSNPLLPALIEVTREQRDRARAAGVLPSAPAAGPA